MKANRLFLLILAAALFTVSCNKYEETVVQGVQMVSRDFTVKSANWFLQDGYYSVALEVPEITKDVVDYGTVQVSRRLTDDKGQIFWTPLPSVRACEADGVLYSEYLDFEWTKGMVYVYFTATDFYTDEKPDDMYFRVMVIL